MNRNANSKNTTVSFLFFILSLFSFNTISGQDKTVIESSFNDYVNLPREVAFAHLNKSLYLKGETIGFSVYVMDKNTKKPSSNSTNVYTVITDENDNPVKEQLIWAKGGKAYGVFSIDSTFAHGNYTFKAYTNWMKNFDEQNLYTQSIKIIDPESTGTSTKTIISSKLDAQFLPEGGHLVANTENTVGVVSKDTLGYAVPNITGRIIDDNSIIVSNFKTNHLGIGKFLLLPDRQRSYTVEIDFRNRIQTFDLSPAEKRGITVTLNQIDSKVALTFNTNSKTLSSIKKKPCTLFIHNGSKSTSIPVEFDDKTKITKAINAEDLFAGINIFTLFNENNQPLLERLYFNYNGIETLETANVFAERKQDSISIQVPVIAMKASEFANLSISVLPGDTKSNNTNHNILSYTFLQPYVNGYIENAKYYFTNVDTKVQYELNNLLLTQGWSSYEWTTIFNNPPQQKFEFENGIAFTANTKNTKGSKYILHASKNHEAQAYVLNDNKRTFSHKGFFVEDDEPLKFTEVIGQTKMKKPNLYLQFSPSKLPKIDNFSSALALKESTVFEANSADIVFDTEFNNIEELDEVVIKANIEKKRLDKLFKKFSSGTIDFFDDEQRTHEIDVATYLGKKGYKTTQDFGRLKVEILRAGGWYEPSIYLNGQILLDIDVLANVSMRSIDYIVADRTTTQYDATKIYKGGSIHIKTDANLLFKNDTRKVFEQDVNPPLTFTSPKTYYAPKYVYYESEFFREYGVIDWFPNVTLTTSEPINLKFLDTKSKEIKLYIEGVTNEGRYISEEKVITLN